MIVGEPEPVQLSASLWPPTSNLPSMFFAVASTVPTLQAAAATSVTVSDRAAMRSLELMLLPPSDSRDACTRSGGSALPPGPLLAKRCEP